jgi:hypothetical protein
MSRFRTTMRQSPAIIISLVALTFSLGSGAGYAASTVASRPAAAPKITWHRLPLRNGWQAAAKGYGGGAPAYTISNSVVYLTGIASRANQNAPLGELGLLPKSARPKHVLWFEAFNYAGSGQSTIQVFPSGEVQVLGTGGDENYFTSLAGIEFPLGS